MLFLFTIIKQTVWNPTYKNLPTQLFNETMSVPGDLARKLDHINSFENYVVGLHWI